MKKSNDTIGNRTRDLPACSAVPQPTAPPANSAYAVCQMHNMLSLFITDQGVGSEVEGGGFDMAG
jgi:hypothetical protein